MTLAEQYRSAATSWASYEDWLAFVVQLDLEVQVTRTDLGATLLFSDGSFHRLAKQPNRSFAK